MYLLNLIYYVGGSSTNKTDRHNTTAILLKVGLNTIKQTNKHLKIKINSPYCYRVGQCARASSHAIRIDLITFVCVLPVIFYHLCINAKTCQQIGKVKTDRFV
jgi:isocitrate dehydrogenase